MEGRLDLSALLKKFCHQLVVQLPADQQTRHATPYTGIAGIAQLFLHIHDADNDFKLTLKRDDGQTMERSALDLAGDYIDMACCWVDVTRASPSEMRHCGFLCTEVGIRAIATIIYQRQARLTESIEQLRRVLSFSMTIEMPDTPSELLYGRAGYLYALGYIRTNLVTGQDTSAELLELLNRIDTLVDILYTAILEDGRRTARELGLASKTPLLWQWHGKAYIGAAHGMAGILTVLMAWPDHARRHALELHAALNFLLVTTAEPAQLPNNEDGRLLNWPSSINTSKRASHSAALASGRMDLVQFCHGAPGIALCAIKAYQVFNDEHYLQQAGLAAETSWQAGIGHKGVGLCHGVAGNAYPQAMLHRITREAKYATRVDKLIDTCAHWEDLTRSEQFRLPSHPWSIWEGIGGVAWLLADLIYTPSNTCMGFPCLSDIGYVFNC